MGSFGSVIPVTGLNLGYLGQVSRTGGGDPFIVAKFANAANLNNISFGDPVFLMPDETGGTYRQADDWLTNAGAAVFTSVNLSSGSPTATPASMAGLQINQFVIGSGIPAGTIITAIGTSTFTMSKNATSNETGGGLYIADFGGIAVREVKTQLTYPIAPGGSLVGLYQPGQMTESLVRGAITVAINYGTPFAGCPVYLRCIANSSIPAGVVGGLEAAPDGTNSVLLPDIQFKTGVLDANNVAEIVLLTRRSA